MNREIKGIYLLLGRETGEGSKKLTVRKFSAFFFDFPIFFCYTFNILVVVNRRFIKKDS